MTMSQPAHQGRNTQYPYNAMVEIDTSVAGVFLHRRHCVDVGVAALNMANMAAVAPLVSVVSNWAAPTLNGSDDSLWASGHCFRSVKRVTVFDTQLRLFGFGLYDGRVLVSVFLAFGMDGMPSRLWTVGSCVNCRSSGYN